MLSVYLLLLCLIIGPFPVQYAPIKTEDSKHYSINENGTLTITEVTEADSGHYLCRADNHIGHGLSKIIFLTVLGELLFCNCLLTDA